MNIGLMWKRFQFTIMQQAGIPVTPEKVGLKAEDIPGFQSVLGNVAGANGVGAQAGGQGLQVPQPPTPPADPTDLKAQQKFNEEMVAYNQQLFAYNQRMFQLMMQQAQHQNLQNRGISSISRGSSSIGGLASAGLPDSGIGPTGGII